MVQRDQTQAPFRDWLTDISDVHIPAEQVELLVVPLQSLDLDHKIAMQLAKRTDRGRRDHAGAKPNHQPAGTAGRPRHPLPGRVDRLQQRRRILKQLTSGFGQRNVASIAL